MKRIALSSAFVSLLAFLSPNLLAAGTLTGLVRNGTTGAPAPGVDVVLIQLQGGMETVASTKSDAQGRYRIQHPGIGRQPMLVRVNYRGVNFHQSLPPGREAADIDVFEPTADAEVVQMASRLIVVEPNGALLLVGEEYSVQNRSTPAKAYYKPEGNFEFQIPAGGELAQVSAWGPSGMPVVQSTMDLGNRRYAIAFAFRPGESGVRLSYHIPYNSNQAILRVPSLYATQRVLVVAPPTMQVSSPGFQAAGTEQGWNVYARDAVPARQAFDISVSGTAPPPSASGESSQQEARGRDAGQLEGTVQPMPARLDSIKWVLIGGFAALFFLGVIFLWRRPAGIPVRGTAPATPAAQSPRNESKGAEVISGLAAEFDREISHSLDELKDTLFRLELRRQAGTISEEDYARERGRAENVLRDLVKG